eukprot:TRINITY_DN1534_c0_g2_i2.p1 TRINITY_DN1534_c0_g2~~TRINITY_DN1534_c0_g2_i2.p1  ORF type:complete len:179 (-),score=54.96 TRINITY_DN1534_c0_g2_i2:84-620(-)
MTIFLLAVCENRLELVQLVLQSAVNRRELLSQCDSYGNGAIHLAVLADSSSIISFLINEGMQTDRRNKLGETPTDLAKSLKRSQELLSLLTLADLPRDTTELLQESKAQVSPPTVKAECKEFPEYAREYNGKEMGRGSGLAGKNGNSVLTSGEGSRRESKKKLFDQPEVIKIKVKQKA